jgi:hypothetical protein
MRPAGSTAALLCLIVTTSAAAAPPAGPLRQLQDRIDELASRFAPPSVSYALVCRGALEAELTVTVSDDHEVAQLAIQEQGGDPPANIIIFVEPGLTSASYTLTLELGPGERRLLLVGSDSYGNTAKALALLSADACSAL